MRKIAKVQRPLTRKEVEVCKRVALGKADKVIAHELGITVDGVRKRLKAVFIKSGVESRYELVSWFLFLSEEAAEARLRISGRFK